MIEKRDSNRKSRNEFEWPKAIKKNLQVLATLDKNGVPLVPRHGGTITGSSAQLVWQYVRFNPRYQGHFDWLIEKQTRIGKLRGLSASDRENAVELAKQLFANEWCLESPVHYATDVLPKAIFRPRTFVKIPYKWLTHEKLSFVILEQLASLSRNGSLMLIDSNATKDAAAAIASALPDTTPLDRRPYNVDGFLADYFSFFFMIELNGLTPTQAFREYSFLFPHRKPAVMQSHMIRAKVARFKAISCKAPQCFLVAPRSPTGSKRNRK